jgi:hypothetical protein
VRLVQLDKKVRPALLVQLDKKARPALLVQLARRVLKACKVLKVKQVPLGPLAQPVRHRFAS